MCQDSYNKSPEEEEEENWTSPARVREGGFASENPHGVLRRICRFLELPNCPALAGILLICVMSMCEEKRTNTHIYEQYIYVHI